MKINQKLLLAVICSAFPLQSYSAAAVAADFVSAGISNPASSQRSLCNRFGPLGVALAAGGALWYYQKIQKPAQAIRNDMKILGEIRRRAAELQVIDVSCVDRLQNIEDKSTKERLHGTITKYNNAPVEQESQRPVDLSQSREPGLLSSLSHRGDFDAVPADASVASLSATRIHNYARPTTPTARPAGAAAAREEIKSRHEESTKLSHYTYQLTRALEFERQNLSPLARLKRTNKDKVKKDAQKLAKNTGRKIRALPTSDKIMYGGLAAAFVGAGIWAVVRK